LRSSDGSRLVDGRLDPGFGVVEQPHDPAGMAVAVGTTGPACEPTALTLKDLCGVAELAWADQPGQVFD